jgi:hypothetical protein
MFKHPGLRASVYVWRMRMERLRGASTIVVAAAVMAGGCGGKRPPAASPSEAAQGAGGGAAAAEPEPAESPAGDEDGPEQLPKVQASCLPAGSYHYVLGRTGGKLVLCGTTSRGTLFGCWGVDGKGALSARATSPIPGTAVAVDAAKGCHEGLCWKPPGEDAAFDKVRVAMHPDGKRAAALVGEDVTIYDVASKKATLTFPLRKNGDLVGEHEVSNGPVTLWFAGEGVFILGLDAGPAGALFPYSVGGKALGPAYWSVYMGGVAIDEDKLVLNEDALKKLTTLDGRAKGGKTIVRQLPKSPCKPEEDPELEIPEDYQPGTNKCFDYQLKHLSQYHAAQIVSDGAGYVGLTPGAALFTLDGKLAE